MVLALPLPKKTTCTAETTARLVISTEIAPRHGCSPKSRLFRTLVHPLLTLAVLVVLRCLHALHAPPAALESDDSSEAAGAASASPSGPGPADTTHMAGRTTRSPIL